MIKKSFLFILLILSFSSCKELNDQRISENAGGTFSCALLNAPSTFVARNISDVYSSKVASQVLEGLVSLDPKTLKPVPRIAKSIKESKDGLTYTFELKNNIYFHPHTAIGSHRKLSVDDVIYTFELICSEKPKTVAYSTVFEDAVEGAKAFHNNKAKTIKGISASGNTIKIKLKKRDNKFLDKLSMINTAILAREVIQAGDETALIGTGPFKYSKTQLIEDKKTIVLTKNERYHKKDKDQNSLPYLDSIVFFIESKNLEQFSLFEKQKIDVIEGLPPNRITDMLEGKMVDFSSTPPKLLLRRKPILATQFYIFNLLEEKFKDVRVRQAINYALNRGKIVNDILNHQAYDIGDAGLIPPAAFSGYDTKEVKKFSYTYQPDKAKKLLAKAGYPNGEGFPTIDLKFNFSAVHSAVAEEFAKQMKNTLNINVNITGMNFEDKENDANLGKGDIFRSSWYADYYGVESFLQNAYGKAIPDNPEALSMVNTARYNNAQFNDFYEAGRDASTILEQYKNFVEAEKVMMKEAPFIILWYEESIILSYSKVRNLSLNPLCYYDFSEVFIKEWTSEEYTQKVLNNKR